jgi:hypothetical protein
MEFVLDRVREYLGTSCDPQLRLVSRRCRDAMNSFPRELPRVEDFISSVALFVWARKKLRMPKTEAICCRVARSGGLEMNIYLNFILSFSVFNQFSS